MTLADKYQGKRLNSPNDAALKSNGDIYFTDPPYGLPKRYDDPRRELDHCGVYRIAVDGKLTLLTTALERPNGIGFAPDERRLCRSVRSEESHLDAFPSQRRWYAGRLESTLRRHELSGRCESRFARWFGCRCLG